jgi:alkanesulfonate monooxygenase SsuD/methylene tetrahydromethanopterin reductase-like flavin-dependent oxidoreductase (luciferase family)
VLEELGVALSPAADELSPTALDDAVRSVVDAGFDSLWTLDNPLADQAEPLTFLTGAAARHDSLRVGTAAIVAPVRDPVLLAKQVATLDRITGGGRVALGLTIGRRPAEYELTGHDFHRRGRLLEDVVRVVRQCWAAERVEVDGAEHSWHSDVAIGVPPATPAGPPILLGGLSERALRRAVDLGDGYVGSATGGPRQAAASIARVAELLAEAGGARETFRTVTNVFVLAADSRAAAIDRATTVFSARHGGHPPPWDPAEVVLGGPAAEIADGVAELVAAGYRGVTMVPVDGSIEQLNALRPAVALARDHATSLAPSR